MFKARISDYKNINEIIEAGWTVIKVPVTLPGMSRFVTYIKLKNLANKQSIVEMFCISREQCFYIEDYRATKEYTQIQTPNKEERVFVDVLKSLDISETPTSLKEEKILFSFGYDERLVIRSETKCVIFINFFDL